jgi:hypothetical protein
VTEKLVTNAVKTKHFGGYAFGIRLAPAVLLHLVTIALFGPLFFSFIFAQDRTPLTLNQVSDLLKQGISSSRIAQLVEQYGVAFELNDAASKRLRQDGADEVVLSAVKRMAARYTEEQQRRKRAETEEAKRREQEEAQRRAERKKQEEQAKQRELEKKGTKKPEDTAQGADAIRKRLQEEANRRAAETKPKEEQKREPPAVAKGSQEPPQKSEEPRVVLPFDKTSKPQFDQPPKAQEEAKQGSQKGPGPALRTPEDADRVASLRNVTSTPEGEVSGEIANNSNHTVRDVRLQILYSWRWKNETRPGKDDPGTVNYHSLNQEIPPGKTTRFNYKPSPPLPSRTDGQFDITVKIIGFEEIFPGVRK